MTNYKIPPDEQAILALQRVAGARVHEAANLIQRYQWSCYTGDEDSAAAAKRSMWGLASQIERERGAQDEMLFFSPASSTQSLRGNVENQNKATEQVIVLKMTPERVERLRRIVESINDLLIDGTQEAAEAFIALGLVKRAWEIGYGVEFDDRHLETATTPALDC